MTLDPRQRYLVSAPQARAELHQRSHLFRVGLTWSSLPVRIVAAAEIAHNRDAQKGVVSFGMRALAVFRPARLDPAVRQDHKVVSHVKDLSSADGFHSAFSMVVINFFHAPGNGIV